MVNTRIEGDNLFKARKLLADIINYLDFLEIEYHLEGGTLLGFVRDGEFLEWDHDIDLSIPSRFTEKFYANRRFLWKKGYRVTKRSSIIDIGPIKKGELRVFKVKSLLRSFRSMFSARVRNSMLVADIFIKFDDESHTFWIAKERVMKASSEFYKGYEEIEYNGRNYKVPVNFRGYLTHKYGDWTTPVKEWDCAIDEKSIISKVS